MRLRDWALHEGIAYQTAWNKFKKGLIPGAYKENGIILVDEAEECIVVYAHGLSSTEAKNQIELLSNFCKKKNWIVTEFMFDVEDCYDELRSVFDYATRIVILNKDVIPSFDLISHLCYLLGCKIEVMEENG